MFLFIVFFSLYFFFLLIIIFLFLFGELWDFHVFLFARHPIIVVILTRAYAARDAPQRTPERNIFTLKIILLHFDTKYIYIKKEGKSISILSLFSSFTGTGEFHHSQHFYSVPFFPLHVKNIWSTMRVVLCSSTAMIEKEDEEEEKKTTQRNNNRIM